MTTLAVKSVRSRPGPKLNELQKRAICARLATGEDKSLIAKDFNVSRQTVHALAKSITDLSGSPLRSAGDWRKRLSEEMPPMSVDAMARSIQDAEDPHKAAVTAIAHLKGIGVLGGDGQSTNISVTINMIRSLPLDMQEEYRLTGIMDEPVRNVTPQASDPHQ